MPVAARGGGAASPVSATKPSFFPAAGFGRERAGSAVSSATVFHSPQVSHRPAHFGVTAPQAWQTKRATGRAMSARPGGGR